jgi:4-amino-4-deoxy-L-arabinose transferase-like glycosyltransferase
MIVSDSDIANCELKIANCKLNTRLPSGALDVKDRPASHFANCNLQFAICSAFLLLLCGVLFFHCLADRDLWNSHEGRAAQNAQTILDSGDWLLPRLFDGRIEMQKPPLYYWLIAGVAKLRGVNVDAWAVRLPAALAALACVLGVLFWGHRRGRPLAGLLSAVILATAVHFTWLARVGRIDMPLTLAIGVALLGYFSSSTKRMVRLFFSYVAIAFGILLKGPIAFVLPAAVVCTHLAVEMELPRPWQVRRWLALFHRLGLWWGLPLVAALALPWFLWANIATDGEWAREFFWRHNFERGFGGGDDPENHWNHPWWLYGPMFVWDFLPWSILLPFAVWRFFRAKRWRDDSEGRFGLVWFTTMIFVLTCMRFKRSDYLLPAYPGAAIFLGCVAERWYLQSSAWFGKTRLNIARIGFVGIVLACALGWLVNLYWGIPKKEPTLEYRAFAAEIRAAAPAPHRICIFWTEAHALVFHVGQPIDLFVEWEKLDALASRPDPTYVVMPAKVAQEWRQHLKSGWLEEVAQNSPAESPPHEKPLILFRTRPNPSPSGP